MLDNFTTSVKNPVRLSIVRDHEKDMEVVVSRSINDDKRRLGEKTVISSKGHIRAPKHDFL